MSDPMEDLATEIDAGVKAMVRSVVRSVPPEVLLPLYEDISLFPPMSGTSVKRLLLLRALVLWYNLLPSLRTNIPPPDDLSAQWEGLANSFAQTLKQQRGWLQGLLGKYLRRHASTYRNAMQLFASLRTYLANRGTTHREGYLLEVVENMSGLR